MQKIFILLFLHFIPTALLLSQENVSYYINGNGTKIYQSPSTPAVYNKQAGGLEYSNEKGWQESSNIDLWHHLYSRYKHYDNRSIHSANPLIFKLLISDNGKLERMKMIKEIDSSSTEVLYNILRTAGSWKPAEENGQAVYSEIYIKLTMPSIKTKFYINLQCLSPIESDLIKDTLKGKIKEFSGSNEIIINDKMDNKYWRLFGIELARQTLPWFMNELKKEKFEKKFYVEVLLKNGDEGELMWLTGLTMKSDTVIKGRLDIDSEILNMKQGTSVEVSTADVKDWMIQEGNEITGNWTNEKMANHTLLKDPPWSLEKLLTDEIQFELAKKAYFSCITLHKELELTEEHKLSVEKTRSFLKDNEKVRIIFEHYSSYEARLKTPRKSYTSEYSKNRKLAFLITPDGKIMNPVDLKIIRSAYPNILKYAETVVPAEKFNSNVLTAVIIEY